jgi:hypothetical protein
MAKVYHIGVGYDDAITIFHLRAITLAEDTRYANRFLEIPQNATEESRTQHEYDIFVDALASWSTEGPTTRVIEKKFVAADGEDEATEQEVEEEKALFPELSASPAEAVKHFFEKRDAQTERIAQALMGAYRNRQKPSVIFY